MSFDKLKRRVWRSVKPERNEVLVLKLDLLAAPPPQTPPVGSPSRLELAPLGPQSFSDVLGMLHREAKERRRSVRERYLQGMEGVVGYLQGKPMGYVFFTPGSDDRRRLVHPDLLWIGHRPRRKDVYLFDYYVCPNARGHGTEFVRHSQHELARLGYERAIGYVYADNRAALWTYRSTGWRELGRFSEHRVLSRFVIVDRMLYWRLPLSRQRLFRLG